MIEASMEQLTAISKFVNTIVVRKPSDFRSRRWPLDGAGLIPAKSNFVHYENLYIQDRIDYMPDMDFPFYDDKNIFKYIKHVDKLTQLKPRGFYRLRVMGLQNKIIEFNKKYRTTWKIMNDSTAPVPTSIMATNFNPLSCFKNKRFQINDIIRYNMDMNRLMLEQLPEDRLNMIVIPIPNDLEINRQQLIKILKMGEMHKTIMPDPNKFNIVLGSLMLFLNSSSHKDSPYSAIQGSNLNSTYFFFHNNKRCMIVPVSVYKAISNQADLKRLFDTLELMSVKTTRTNVEDEEVNTPIDAGMTPSAKTKVASSEDDVIPPTTGTGTTLANIANIDENDDVGIDLGEAIDLDDEIKMDTDAESVDIFTEAFIEEQTHLTPAAKERAKTISKRYQSVNVTVGGKKVKLTDILDDVQPIKVDNTPNVNLKGKVIDDSYLSSRSTTIDQQYLNTHFERHIASSLIAFQANGLFLSDLNYEAEDNEFNRVRIITAKFEDVNGKRHTLKVKVPIPDREGRFMLGGIQTKMVKQLVNVPICKISPTRVSLISNYNKTLVDKHRSKRFDMVSFISKNSEKLGIRLNTGKQTFLGLELPYEFKLFGSKLASIKHDDYTLTFSLKTRYADLNVDEKDMTMFEKTYGMLIGKSTKPKGFIFISQDGIVKVVDTKNTEVKETTSLFGIIGRGIVQPPSEWCNLKILDKDIPIVIVLAYKYGLTKVLQNINAKYRIVKGRKFDLSPTEVVIPFKDCKLIVDRYPLEGSLILNGLANYKTQQYEIHEMDDESAFYDLFESKGLSINYLTGIRSYFSFFIDPVTFEVLKEMGEPTNTKDLLIRSVQMLVGAPDREPSSVRNFRVRNYEKIPVMIYNEISRQYANYSNSAYKNKTFSINPEGVYQRLIQDENMVLEEVINPIHSIKFRTKATPAGFGGRSKESFVERDRRYPTDGLGRLSESTVDSAGAGMTTELPPDSNIENVFGMFGGDDLDTVNILSLTSNLMPGVTNDDPKRANFVNIQLSHVVPVDAYQPNRVCTGYETVIAQQTTSDFVVRAEGPGKIVEINSKAQLIKVLYKDGNTAVYEYGELTGNASGVSYNHDLVLKDGVKVGKTVKEGEVLAYHNGFFKMDPILNEPIWCHGVNGKVAVTLSDATLEDSNIVTKAFAEKFTFNPIYPVVNVIDSTMDIAEYKKVGDEVEYDSHLMVTKYQLDPTLGDVDELFEELQQSRYRAKHKGVVKAIKIYTSTEDLSESMMKFVKDVTKPARVKAKFSKGSIDEGKHSPVLLVPAGSRIGGKTMPEDSLIVTYEIKSTQGLGIGDKIIFDSSLKTVVGEVVDYIEDEDGNPIDAKFSALSIFARVVTSPFIQGICNSILIDAEKKLVNMLNDGKKKGSTESITFPSPEHTSLLERLNNNQPIYTTRVSAEMGKYKVGDKLTSDLGKDLTVTEVKLYKDVKDHPFYSELTPEQINIIGMYPEFELVKLKAS